MMSLPISTARPKPLACYLVTRSDDVAEQVSTQVSSGGMGDQRIRLPGGGAHVAVRRDRPQRHRLPLGLRRLRELLAYQVGVQLCRRQPADVRHPPALRRHGPGVCGCGIYPHGMMKSGT